MHRISSAFNTLKARLHRWGRTLGRLWVCLPYAWLITFFCIPFLIIAKISFADISLGIPPYSCLIRWTDPWVVELRFTLANYVWALSDRIYLVAYGQSLAMALMVTFFCWMIGYPMAYGIVRCSARWRLPLLLMIILPFWISFLIRIYAWMTLLSPHGLINALLTKLHLINEPILLLDRPFAALLGMVYAYLPFMVLPLYASLSKIDPSLIEAAYDLGARPLTAFWRVLFPLSLPGAFSGGMLVFIPAVGEFVIPELLGGPRLLMIGRILWGEFFQNRDWPLTSALAVIMLVGLLLPIALLQRFQSAQELAKNSSPTPEKT